MKKALVVFLALALVAGVFADEPVAEASVAKFSGEASVTWGVDLDAGKTGFSNSEKAELEIVFVKGGDKATSGDGVWGEIKIKTEGLQYKKANENNGSKNANWNGDKGFAELAEAVLHLGSAYVGIRSGDTQVGEYTAPRALDYDEHNVAEVANVGEKKEKGITLGYSAGNIFKIDVDFRSQPVASAAAVAETYKIAKDKDGKLVLETVAGSAAVTGTNYTNDYGVAAEITSKPISGLEIKAGYSIAFTSVAMGAGFKAEYNMPIGDAGMYIKPGVGYVNTLKNDFGKLAFGVLFGFSDETGKDDPGLPLFNADNSKKSNAGVSFATLVDLNKTSAIPLYFDVWTGSKLVPNLGAAAFFRTPAFSSIGSNFTFGLGVKYGIGVGAATITPQAGFMMSNTASMKAKAGVVIGGAVSNTEFSVWYTSGELKSSKIGTIDLTCKISI